MSEKMQGNVKDVQQYINARKLAEDFIVNGNNNKSEIDRLYGNGETELQKDFGFKFVAALVDYTVYQVSNTEHIEKSLKMFSKALGQLDDSKSSYGIDFFVKRIKEDDKDFFNDKNMIKYLRSNIKSEAVNKIIDSINFNNSTKKMYI